MKTDLAEVESDLDIDLDGKFADEVYETFLQVTEKMMVKVVQASIDCLASQTQCITCIIIYPCLCV